MSKQPTTMDDLLEEFEFEVETGPTPGPSDGISIDMGTEEEIAAEAAEAERLVAEASANEGKTEEEIAAEAERLAAEAAELEAAAKQAQQGNNSGYKEIALKYIENGTWSQDLAIEDAEGNPVPISELKEIDQDTFFQIDEAVKAQNAEENKSKFISIEGVEDRRKNIIEIVKEGGDLTQIFNSPQEMEDYINPFSKFDLEDENVQARVYLNALIKHNKLDVDTAQTVVDKAKKDLTLDSKVKTYVEKYTESFDKYVETKKAEILQTKKDEQKAQGEFKKALKEQYKAYNLKDALANKLAASAVNKKDGEFEIDTVYAEKMENPEEAAELILFLTDKQAYLDLKMKDNNIKQQKKFRQIVKIIPREQAKKTDNKTDDFNEVDNEFEFTVK